MARSKTPAARAAPSAADTATHPAPAPVAPAAGGSPAAAVLAALSAHPAGAAVAVIAAHAGISTAAARQALIAHEKAGAATRTKGGRPGIPDTWKPAATPATPRSDVPPAQALGAGRTAGSGQAAAGSPDAARPAPAEGTADGGKAEAGTGSAPDPAAEAAASVQALAQAAGEASKALAAGDLPAALAALEAARDQATLGRRAIKAAASGRHAPAIRPGGLRDLVEQHLRTFPDAAFTPHQIGKVLARSSGAVANALDRLVSLGTAEMASDKPRTYRLTPTQPGSSAQATASAA